MQTIQVEVKKTVEMVQHTCEHCSAFFATERNRRQKHCPECCQPVGTPKTIKRKSPEKVEMSLKTIAGQMKFIRTYRGMSQKAFATYLQGKERAPMRITDPYIAQFERGYGKKQLPDKTYKWLVAWVSQEFKKPVYAQAQMKLDN